MKLKQKQWGGRGWESKYKIVWPKRQECERKHTFFLSHNNI
jgi:preprotein translocase subunit SecE